jgi:hypothetical protein
MTKSFGLVAVLAILASACATSNAPSAGPIVGNRGEWFEVAVNNGTPMTLRVFALVDGGEVSLGRVDALSIEDVRVPSGMGGTLRLVARPAAFTSPDRRHVSEPVSIMPGQKITWELRPSPGISDVPRMSMIRVRACTEAC